MGLLDPPSTSSATAILNDLTRWRLDHFGFITIRGTYSSQDKWDQFMHLAQQDGHEYFAARNMLHLYEKMAWTVIEDPAALDGASLKTAQAKFREWVDGEEGKKDVEGSVFAEEGVVYRGPRYRFFVWVDEEGLESVVDEGKARERVRGYTVKLVVKGKEGVEENEDEDEDEEEEEMDEDDRERELEDVRKRVKVDKLVEMYARLLDVNSWYLLPVEDGVVLI